MIDVKMLANVTVSGPRLSPDSDDFIFTVSLNGKFIRVYADMTRVKSGELKELEHLLGKAVTTLLLANQ